jgi:lipoate synthase
MFLCEFLVTFWKLYYAIRVLLVVEYVKPEEFDYFRQVVEEIVCRYMASGPMVQSSYQNGEISWERTIKLDRAASVWLH